MDIQRLVLFLVFSFSVVFLWEAWNKEQAAITGKAQRAQQTQTGVPAASPPSTPPLTTPTAPAVSTAPVAATPSASSQAAATKGETIEVETDLVRARISTLGGVIVYLELLAHKDTVDQSRNLVLLGPEHRYVVQSGLTGEGNANHTTLFKAEVVSNKLQPGKDVLDVRLNSPISGTGIEVVKTISFRRGSYLIESTHELRNKGKQPFDAFVYHQLTRDGKPPAGDSKMLPTYTGAAVYSEQDKFIKIDFSDIEKRKSNFTAATDNGWIAMLQHYFVSAILPPEGMQREYYTNRLSDNFYSVGVKVPTGAVAPGSSVTQKTSYYVGPEEQEKLKSIAKGLEYSVDYGMLTIIAVPLFWILHWFHSWVGNWGLAIILLTVLIKLVFFPLSAASYRSMAKMKLVTPKMMKIREQFANDRMKQNQAMMELYKKEKINPLGGCLPVLVQIPVFISLYWVLLASVELRHAPFYGWIHDLSATDPYFILPALMMGSMVIQTRMNPTPPDPVQAKVMQIMPIAFGVMFFFFPAGLVLYWLVNNVLSIAQQWQITRMIEGGKTSASAKH